MSRTTFSYLLFLIILTILVQLAGHLVAWKLTPPTANTSCDPSHVPWRYRIHVFAWRRIHSLQRLLASLTAAQYDGVSVELHFFIEGDPVAGVVNLAENFTWPHGLKSIHVHPYRVGLATNIMLSWLPKEHTEVAIMLEDDIAVSPHYFRWLTRSFRRLLMTSKDPNIIGVSLNSVRIDQITTQQRRKRLAMLGLRKDDSLDADPFWRNISNPMPNTILSQVPNSWGAAYFAAPWQEFLRFWEVTQSEVDSHFPMVTVPHSMTYQWERSWKKFLVELMYARGWTMIYPNFPDGRSFSVHYQERGQHTGKAGASQDELADASAQKVDTRMQVPLFSATMTQWMSDEDTMKDVPVVDIYSMESSKEELERRACSHHATWAAKVPLHIAKAWFGNIYCATNSTNAKLATMFAAFQRTTWSEDIAFAELANEWSKEVWPHEFVVVAPPNACSFVRAKTVANCIELKCWTTAKQPSTSCLFSFAATLLDTDLLLYVNALVRPFANVADVISRMPRAALTFATCSHSSPLPCLIAGAHNDLFNVARNCAMTFARPGWYEELFYHAARLSIPVVDVSNVVSCRVIPPVSPIKISDWANFAQWSSLLVSKIPTFILTNDTEVPWQLKIRDKGDITRTGFLTHAHALLESASDCSIRNTSVFSVAHASVACVHQVIINCTASEASSSANHLIVFFNDDCVQRVVADISELVASRPCIALLPPSYILYLQSSSQFQPPFVLWCFPQN